MASYMAQRPMLQLVDSMTNCDDMLLNAIVANATGKAPIGVQASVLRHPSWRSTTAMWKADPEWTTHRAQCMEAIQAYYHPEGERAAGAGWPTGPPELQSNAVWRRSTTWATCDVALSPE